MEKKSYIRRNLTFGSDIFLSKRHATIRLELQNGLHREHILRKYSFTMKMYPLLMLKIYVFGCFQGKGTMYDGTCFSPAKSLGSHDQQINLSSAGFLPLFGVIF